MLGVFDLGFRSGNKDNPEFTFQVGAVSGIEALAEGPLNKKRVSSPILCIGFNFKGNICSLIYSVEYDIANQVGIEPT